MRYEIKYTDCKYNRVDGESGEGWNEAETYAAAEEEVTDWHLSGGENRKGIDFAHNTHCPTRCFAAGTDIVIAEIIDRDAEYAQNLPHVWE